jgi:ribosome recycling factor
VGAQEQLTRHAVICELRTFCFQKSIAHTTRCAFHASTTLNATKLRNFSKFPPLYKKAGKANKSHAKSDSSPPVNMAGGPTPTDEIYDMGELESSVLKAMEKLTHDLAQLRSGGRLNPEIVESLKVQLGTAGQGKETVRLGDIAQVVPRGRVLNVICGDDTVSCLT